MNSASFSVGRHELDHRRASMPRTTARNSAPDPGYPEGARAEKRSASRKPSVVTSVDRDESGRRLRGLQIARRLLAPLGHDVVTDLLAFHKAAHAGALHRTDVHEHVLAAVARLDESKAFLSIEELHGTCGHHGLLDHITMSVCPITRACVAGHPIFGSLAGHRKTGASRGRPKTG